MLGNEDRSRNLEQNLEEHLIFEMSQGNEEKVVKEIIKGEPRKCRVQEAGMRVCFKTGAVGTPMAIAFQCRGHSLIPGQGTKPTGLRASHKLKKNRSGQ